MTRGAVVLVTVAAIGVAAIAITEGDLALVAVSAVTAVAFACNLLKQLPKPIRIVAFIVQVMTVFGVTVILLMLLAFADAGTTGAEQVPWWFWVAAAASGLLVYKATVAGYDLARGNR